ncbi:MULTISPECIES: dCTP deaminase domain-containing protein [Enterobacteriaceae]|uniref:dCTP deaminase domain-containing protein n=1 Tax=Enterobacteriaceae TaxID=543 RepID=UPI0013309961|nr:MULTISPECIES: hypothetical protein [Enterobacteriaceae]MBG2688518.1 hypothetical protein [Klebsiella oxytoca]MBG2694111.1 hypothetical protein [Klebsiella oxytoca]MBJ9162912.1 hypothetical protein [Citrobacter farmeri]MCM7407077.1 hypothetical protein [Enterobacter cloacae]HBQ6673596.1 hypothetical protein [Klebsiella pneumoniae]
MQLDSTVAIRLGYVRDNRGNLLNPADYSKASSVDLTIGEILKKDNNENIVQGVGAKLKPQESLVIISDEIIHVPPDHVAYVFLKNRLSQKGLLALNTGIIDANYVGPISTVVINFSNVDAVIPSGRTKEQKEFFRVVFHKLDSALPGSQVLQAVGNYSDQDYNDYKNNKLNDLKNFPKTFLEPKVLKQQIQDEIYSKVSEFSMVKVGFTIALLGLFFTFLPMVKDWIFAWQYDFKDGLITQKKNEYKIESLENDVEKLKEQIRTLELKPDNRNKGR